MGYKEVSFSNDINFLVTGGAGFIGSNICEALLNMGNSVTCLDNFSTGLEENIKPFMNNKMFKLIRGDIRNLDTCNKACENIDYVFHEAAWGSVPRSIEMPLLYDDINIKGTLNMLEAARKNNVKRFIYASSSAVYGDNEELPKKEGEEGNVLSPYALTKKTNEEYANLYYKLFGLQTIGLRYFNVFGKKQNSNSPYAAVIPKFVNLLLEGKQPIIYGNGEQSRDFIYIESVIEGNLKACICNSDACGQVFNIAFGDKITLNDLYIKIKKYINSNIEPIYKEKRKGDIMHSNADISKSREFLNYSPDYDLEKGIELTIEWYKNKIIR